MKDKKRDLNLLYLYRITYKNNKLYIYIYIDLTQNKIVKLSW